MKFIFQAPRRLRQVFSLCKQYRIRTKRKYTRCSTSQRAMVYFYFLRLLSCLICKAICFSAFITDLVILHIYKSFVINCTDNVCHVQQRLNAKKTNDGSGDDSKLKHHWECSSPPQSGSPSVISTTRSASCPCEAKAIQTKEFRRITSLPQSASTNACDIGSSLSPFQATKNPVDRQQ